MKKQRSAKTMAMMMYMWAMDMCMGMCMRFVAVISGKFSFPCIQHEIA